MKKSAVIIATLLVLTLVSGCGRQQTAFLPGVEDFLSANTITGLLNRYDTVACFEKLLHTTEEEEITRSMQYHHDERTRISQLSDGDKTDLYYKGMLFQREKAGGEVSYTLYLNQSDQYEKMYFEHKDLFGQQYGAEISFLGEKEGNFVFTSTFAIDEHSVDEYSRWDATIGDVITGTYTVAKDDLRLIKSEVRKKHAGKEETILVNSWIYARPLQLDEMWQNYRDIPVEKRVHVTTKYPDGTESLFYFPTGSTPVLKTDEGHNLYLDEKYTQPYVTAPIKGNITLYYQ